MSRIVHLSDLHFGRTDPALFAPLVEAVNGLKPDLTVISGDFTQRARVWQFEEARAFLNRLSGPVLSVPGNHDTPLDNPFMRFLMPWKRYRRFISRELEPEFRSDDMAVVGVNTVNRFAWQQGRMPKHALSRAKKAFVEAGDAARIVVLHHPLEQLPGARKPVMRGASKAVEGFAEAGADIVLSGHIHNTHIAPFTNYPHVLFVQAGTVLSTRLRGEKNSFNLIDIDRARVEIAALAVDEAGRFASTPPHVFRKGGEGWIAAGTGTSAAASIAEASSDSALQGEPVLAPPEGELAPMTGQTGEPGRSDMDETINLTPPSPRAARGG